MNEAAFGTGSRQEVHERRSKWCVDAERLVASVARGILTGNDTFGGGGFRGFGGAVALDGVDRKELAEIWSRNRQLRAML